MESGLYEGGGGRKVERFLRMPRLWSTTEITVMSSVVNGLARYNAQFEQEQV